MPDAKDEGFNRNNMDMSDVNDRDIKKMLDIREEGLKLRI
jgi:hypothetical protein